MSNEIIHTKSLLVGRRPIGENDLLLTVLSDKIGVITAIASGARKEESKNRFGLQVGSISNIDIVRGREFWRIGSTESLLHIPTLYFVPVWRALRVVSQFYQGEVAHPEIINLFERIYKIENLKKKEVELLLVYGILNELGYIDDTLDTLSNVNLVMEDFNHNSYIKAINNAMSSSHLVS